MAKAVQKTKARKARPRKKTGVKNKLGVKNSLVNNINARKKKRINRSKKKSTVSRKAYSDMEKKWDEG